MSGRGKVLLISISLLLSGLSLFAQDYNTWSAGADGNWNVGANWSKGWVPTSDETARIDTAWTITLNTSPTIGALEFTAGTIQDDGGFPIRKITIAAVGTENGNVEITGAGFDTAIGLDMRKQADSTLETSLQIGDLTVNPNAGNTISVITNDLDISGSLLVSSGTFDAGALNVTVGDALTVAGTLDLSGNGDLTVGGNASFTGGNYVKGSGWFYFNGGGVQTLTSAGEDLGSVRTFGAGTHLQPQDISDFDDLRIVAGTFLTTSTAMSISGNLSGAGIFNGGAGDITFTGNPAAISMGITTTGGNIIFNNAVNLTSNVALDSAGGNISFGSTVATGGNDLGLDGGAAGNITITGALTGGGDMTVTDGAVQSYQALTVNSLNIQDATTSITLGGNIAATTTIDVNSGGTIIQTGAVTSGTNLDYDAGGTLGINAAIGISGTADIDSTGITTVAAAGNITAGGAVAFGVAKTGTLTTSSDIITTNDNVTFTRAVTLGGAVDIDSAGGDILFSSTIATVGSNLALDGGAGGNVTLSSALTGGGDMTVRDGAIQSYAALTVNSLNIQDATTSVTAAAITATTTVDIASGGSVVLSDTIGAPSGFSSSGTSFNNTGGTIITTNNDITINHSGAVTVGAQLSSGTGNIDIDSSASTVQIAATLDLDSGTVNIDSSGLTTVTAAGSISTIGASSVNFGAVRAGDLSISGGISTGGGAVRFYEPVTLGAGIGVDTTSAGAVPAGASIQFDNTVATGGNNLSLDAGSGGNVTLSGNLTGGGDFDIADGNVQSYQALTVNSLNITDATTSVTFGGNLAATTTIDVDSGGTIVQTGAVTNGTNLDYDAGTTIAINDTINISGAVDIDSTGVTTIAAGANITSGGAVTFGLAKTGTLTTSGDIDTSDDNVTFTRAVTLAAAVDFDTVGAAAGNILFNSTVATAGNNIALDAGPAGNITLSSALTGGGDMVVRDGAVQSYQALTVNSLNISDATTSVTTGGILTATTSVVIVSGGTVDLNAAVIAPSGFGSSGTTFDNTGGTITTTNNDITVNHSSTITIGAALSSGNGNIALSAADGITLDTAASDLTTTGGDITIDADTDTDNAGTYSQANAGAAVSSAGGAVSVTAADFDLTGTIGSGAGAITLKPATAARTIALNDASGSFSLSLAELALLDSTSILTVGSPAGTGTISVGSSGTMNLSAENYSLTLEGISSAVDFNFGAGNTLTLGAGETLNIAAGGNVTASGQTDVTIAGGTLQLSSVGSATLVTQVVNLGSGTASGAVDITNTNLSLDVTGAFGAGNNNIDIDTGTGTFSNTGGTLSAGTQSVSIIADDVDLSNTLTGTAGVTIVAATAARAINLGTDVNLGLTDADLDNISTSLLTIGDVAAGAVTVSAAVSPAAASALHLISGAGYTDSAGITIGSLAIEAGGAVTLNAGHSVTTAAIDAAGQPVTFIENNGFTIGSVDGVNGFSGSSVSITASAGNVTVNNTAAANDINATDAVSLILQGAGAQLAVGAGADVETSANGIGIEADRMSLSGTVTAAGQRVTLVPHTAARLIDIGGADVFATTLGLTDAEIDNITAGILSVGDAAAATINISAAVNPAGTATIHLVTGDGYSDSAGLSVANLAIEGVNAAVLDAGHDVDLLAFDITAAGAGYTFVDSDALTVGTVDGVVGGTTNNGDISISTVNGTLTVNQAVNAGTQDVSLTAAESAEPTTADLILNANITGDAVALSAGDSLNQTGGTVSAASIGIEAEVVTALTVPVNLDIIAFNITGAGNFIFNDADAFTLGTVGSIIGGTTASGNIGLSSTNGTITVSDAVSSGGAGTLSIDANGATSDIAVNAAVSISGGTISLTADDDIFFTAAGDVDSNNGIITVTSDADNDNNGTGGELVMNDDTVVDAGNAAINLSADEDITLGSVVTTGAVTVSIVSKNGSIVDGGDGAVDVDAPSAVLDIDAVTGIGSAGNIDIDAATVDAVNSTSGGILLRDYSGLAITRVQNTTTGLISLITNGATILQALGGGVTTGGASTVSIDVRSNASLTVNDSVSSNGNTVTLLADDDITFGADGDVDSNNGLVTITADDDNDNNGAGGSLTMNDDTLIDAGNAAITLSADEDLTLGSVTTSGAVTVGITSKNGGIVDGGNSLVDVDAASATLNIDAETGIGSLGDIDTVIAVLDAVNATSGAFQLTETAAGGALEIYQAAQTSAGNAISIETTNGDLTVTAGQSGVSTSGAGAVTLTAGNSDATNADDLIINDTVTGGTSKLTLSSQVDSVIFGAGGDVTTAGGEIEVSSGASGAVALADGTVFNAAAGLIDINSNGNVTLGRLVTTNNTASAVDILSSAGSILDGGVNGGAEITATGASAEVTLTAAGGIGDGNSIETDIITLTGSTTAAGDVEIDETSGIAISSFTVSDGLFTLTAGGAVTATSLVLSSDAEANDISISSGGGGDIAAGTLTAGTGTLSDVTLNSAGAITDPGGKITAQVLTADSAGAMTLDTTVASIDASISAAGDMIITETNALTLTNIDTNDGAITVTAGGLITASDVDSGGGAGDGVTLTTTTGSIAVSSVTSADTVDVDSDADIYDSADDAAVDITAAGLITLTAVGDIDANASPDDYLELAAGSIVDASSTGAGHIYIRGLGALTLGPVDTVNGSISVTAGDIAVGTVSAGGGGDLVLTSSGSVTDNTSNITADDLTIDTVGGIGDITQFPASGNGWVTTGTPINIDVNELVSISTTAIASEIYLSEANSAVVTLADAVDVAGGNVGAAIIEAGTNLTIGPGVAGINLSNGDYLSLDAGATLTIPSAGLDTNAGSGGLVLSGTTDIIDADRNLILSTDELYFNSGDFGADTTLTTSINSLTAHLTTAGSLTVIETNGITLTDVDTSNGNITVSSGSMSIGDVDAPANNITLTSTGSINDAAADAVEDLSCNNLVIDAVTGIGNTAALETSVAFMDLDNSTSGDIQIIETDAVTVVKAVQATDDDINISTTNGTLTADSGGAPVNVISTLLTGAVTLDANGAASDLAVNDGISTAAGIITLSADDDISFAAEGDITSTSGNLIITADADNGGAASGALTMSNGTLFNTGTGTAALNADEDITLGGLLTSDGGATAVVLTSSEGGIVDGGIAHVDVVAATGRLVIDAVTGIGSAGEIETTVDSLDLDNSTSGDIQIIETDAVTVVKAVQATDDDINISTTNGTLTADSGGAPVNVISTLLTGAVILDANGAASDLAVNDGISTAGGNVTLRADNDAIFAVEGDISTANGDLIVEADADNGGAASGALTMNDNGADDTVFSTGTGLIVLEADEDITIGSLINTNGGPVPCTLTSTEGAIVDGGDVNTDVDLSGELVILAVNGIGHGDAIDTDVSSLNFTTTVGANDIWINEADAVFIRDITRGGTGDVNIDANGTITVWNGQNGITAAGGQVELDANGAGNDIAVNEAIASGGGALNILAADAVTFGVDGDISSGDGTVTVDAGTGAVSMTDGALIDAGAGLIDVDAALDIDLGGLITTSVSATSVTLTSGGAVTDNGGSHSDVVSGGRLVIDAVNGIGSADAIDTSVASLDLDNTTLNNIDINETNAVGIVKIAQLSPGTVNLDANGTITVIAAASGITSSGGQVELDANGAANDIVVDDGIITGGGALNILSTDAVSFGAGGDVLSANGKVTVAAGTGAVTMDDNALINSGGGEIDIDAAGDISIGGLITTDAGVTSVTLTTTAGAVIDSGAAFDDVVSAGRLVIDAVNGVGSAGAIDTDVASIDIDNTAAGNIQINEIDGGADGIAVIQLDQDAVAGTIQLTSAGDVTITAGQSGITADDGAVTVDAGLNTINLDENITTTSGPITLQCIIEVGADVIINSGGGQIDFGDDGADAVNDDGGARNLTITAGAGDVTVPGLIGGGANDFNNITITGNDITLTGIGDAAQDGANGAVIVTSADGGDNGRIILNGTHYRTGGTQAYTGGTDGVLTSFSGNSEFDASAAITFNQLYLDHNLRTLTMLCDFTVGRLIFYRGTLDVNGRTLTTTDDLVVFGGSYDPDDADRGADDDEFKYPEADALVYYPNGGTYNNPTDGDFSTNPNSVFSNLGTSVLDVSGDFYVNGTNMNGIGWTLNVADNTGSNPVGSGPWGSPYAVAFNMTATNCTTVTGGNISAASNVGVGDVNNDVTDGGGNMTYAPAVPGPASLGWDFDRPQITSVETVYDNMVRITFSEPIENTQDEISAVIAQVQFDGDTKPFTGTYFDSDGDQFTPPYTFVSTNTQDDLTTFFLQVNTAGQTWNTDATGISAGNAISTDRQGNERGPAAADPIIPDLTMLKGVFFDAGGHNMNRDYGRDTLASFTATTDECRPALVNVVAGRAERQPGSELIYDAHNYFHLRYSEPVDIGTGAGFSIGDCTAINQRAEATFAAAGEHGGEIIDDGSSVEVEGYFSYGARLPNGSRDGVPASTFYRDNTNGENPSGTHGLTVYIAGYRADAASYFPGYVGEAGVDDASSLTEADMTAVGQSASVSANAFILDADGNAVEPSSDVYDGWTPTIEAAVEADGTFGLIAGLNMPAADYSGWDVDPPCFSIYETGPPAYYEIVSRATTATGLINRLEFFIRDDTEYMNYTVPWDPEADHPDVDILHGVRDSSLTDNTHGSNPYSAFSIADINVATLVNTYNSGLSTDVDNTLFGTINIDDDGYFVLNMSDSGHGWNAITSLQIGYDSSTGLITDLAGNLIPSTSTPLAGVERTPPLIALTLASVGDSKVYVKFSEPVFGNDFVPRTEIAPSDFSFSTSGITITEVEPISYYNGGIMEAWFSLSATLTADTAYSGKIIPNAAAVYDKITNAMLASDIHRVTDIGIGLMEPVWAADSIHNSSLYGTTDYSLRDFDGTGYLTDSNITLEASIIAGSYTSLSSSLYYDVDPPDSVVSDGFWLPSYNNALVPAANKEARGLVPTRAEGGVRDFLIPSDDDEIVSGSEVEFLLMMGDLFCARVQDADDPRTILPWSFVIKDITRQTAGVTILNNVINPENGEQTILTYDLESSGMVVINVFNLAGDLVDVIQRGAQGAGTYTYTWDGTNRAGSIVARGVYFIRVVGPDIDEYRKVMIVK